MIVELQVWARTWGCGDWRREHDIPVLHQQHRPFYEHIHVPEPYQAGMRWIEWHPWRDSYNDEHALNYRLR